MAVAPFSTRYLTYLQACARMVNRDLPYDLIGRSTRGEIKALDSADLRELEGTGRFITDDEVVARWYRESLLSAEGECVFCVGFYVVTGQVGQNRVSAPLVIADAALTCDESTQFTVELKDGPLRPYTPLLGMLLAGSEEVDSASVAALIEEVTKKIPDDYPQPHRMGDFLRTLRSRLPQDRREFLASIPTKMSAAIPRDFVTGREGPLRLHAAPIAIKFDALPDFSVERELGEIIKSDDMPATAVALLARNIGDETKKAAGGEGREDEGAAAGSGDTSIADVLEILTLSESQKAAIGCAKSQPLTVISGPPGTGKSHTIASLAINLAHAGRTVLVTSKTREAVSVVVEKLRECGGEYAVAHVGDRAEQREFARLLRVILEYERLDVRAERRAVEQHSRDLKQVRRQRRELSAAISKLEQFHSLFHRSKRELRDLDHITLPDFLPGHAELETLHENAKWIREALDQPIPAFSHRLRARALLTGISRRLGVVCQPPQATVDAARKAFYKSQLDRASVRLRRERDIRGLWEEHERAVEREKRVSTDYFNAARRLAIATEMQASNDNSPRLRAYAKSLELRTKGAAGRRRSEILEGTDPSLLLKCFPIWAGTSAHLGQTLPLCACLFDYVIIDEASLCDPATAMPALFRAQHAVVVGDEKQLKHRTMLADMKLQTAAQEAGLSVAEADDLGFKRSLFEIALSRAPKSRTFMLDEHFRSLPPIVRFSNEAFYQKRLHIMRRNPANERADVVQFFSCGGRRDERDVIPEEFEEALSLTRQLLGEKPIRSVGVITMTEAQAKYMNARFADELTLEEIRSLRFKCGSPQSFQGDQRHTIILCVGIDQEAHRMSLQHVLDDNRFNVAVTRAEDRMFVVSALPQTDFTGNLRRYHETAKGREAIPANDVADKFDSKFEADVYDLLVAEGWSVEPQYESCGYLIDFVVHKQDRFVAVEVDGPQHFDGEGKYVAKDVERTLRLMRGGWKIERISCFEWEAGLPARREFADRVRTALAAPPHRTVERTRVAPPPPPAAPRPPDPTLF